MKKILFVCVHNSARSQMAEAFANRDGGGAVQAESAGLEPGKLNSNVVRVMQEIGIDISGNSVKSVFDLFKEGRFYNNVITVCDETVAERCPIFPGTKEITKWSFADPSSFQGTEEEILEQTRKVRDEIQKKVEAFLQQLS